MSTAEALKRTADVYAEPERFDFLRAVRKDIGLEPRIFTFTYAPGPASAFPRGGLMSEPMYTLGPTQVWSGGAATCTATLFSYDSARRKNLATTSFNVA